MNNGSCCKQDYVVCTCMGVMKGEIIEAIQKGYDSYEKLQDLLGVGTGCSSCVAEVHEMLKDLSQNIEKEKKG